MKCEVNKLGASKSLNFTKIITEKTCEECGKKFQFMIPRGQYLYKKTYRGHTYYFCSDKCKREWCEACIGQHRTL